MDTIPQTAPHLNSRPKNRPEQVLPNQKATRKTTEKPAGFHPECNPPENEPEIRGDPEGRVRVHQVLRVKHTACPDNLFAPELFSPIAGTRYPYRPELP